MSYNYIGHLNHFRTVRKFKEWWFDNLVTYKSFDSVFNSDEVRHYYYNRVTGILNSLACVNFICLSAYCIHLSNLSGLYQVSICRICFVRQLTYHLFKRDNDRAEWIFSIKIRGEIKKAMHLCILLLVFLVWRFRLPWGLVISNFRIYLSKLWTSYIAF